MSNDRPAVADPDAGTEIATDPNGLNAPLLRRAHFGVVPKQFAFVTLREAISLSSNATCPAPANVATLVTCCVALPIAVEKWLRRTFPDAPPVHARSWHTSATAPPVDMAPDPPVQPVKVVAV